MELRYYEDLKAYIYKKPTAAKFAHDKNSQIIIRKVRLHNGENRPMNNRPTVIGLR